MFIPNLTCSITKSDGGFDRYGQPIPGRTFTSKCSIVRLRVEDEKTSVRSDSSATRGMARENVADARLMFPANTDIEMGDRIDIQGVSLRTMSVFPRHAVSGKFDHYQVDAMIWSD